jgi:hypothetical protein
MWALLVILGFLAFAVGAIWFAWTVVRRKPIEQFPGGAGLLALAILGLIVLLIGIGIRPEAAPEPEKVTQAPDASSELRDELVKVRGQLGAIQRDIDALSGRLDKMEESSFELAVSVARLEALEGADVPVVVDGPVTAISNEAVDTVDLLVLTLRNISRVAAFPLTASSTRVSYSDEDVGVGALAFNEENPAEAANGWSVRWIEGEGPNIGPGEAAEITISLSALEPRLTAGKEFIIEVELPGQSPIELIRVTPDELQPIMQLGPKDRG